MTDPDTTVSESRDHQPEPIVRTVGDLTARHLGREVSVEGRRSVLLAMRLQLPRRPLVALLVRVDGDITSTDYLPLDTACEVLP